MKNGILDQNGNSTQKAKDDGLVESFTPNKDGEYEPETVRDLKLMYPMYAQFSDNHFMKSSQGWLADAYVIRSISSQVLNNPFSD
ncbi:prophage Lp4 protein 12 [Secundilactobacillus paracollinoides DSM 15502 = JCM 11969]|nr:prophage Lp4 protein 12 [Secundilactobacillus paracollinoides DSM 15502 = JCM 11969]